MAPSETSPLLSANGTGSAINSTPLRQHYRKDGTIGLPQTIAHRGFKKQFPENSMGAFKGAIAAGSHAIETDLHLSRDGVVVISHDATLKRCFGIDEYIIDCDWEYLRTLKTLREPYDRMPRLSDLLKHIASPELENVWVLLDIKMDNDANTIIQRIAETVRSVPPGNRPWNERIVLGCWSSDYFPLCDTFLPEFKTALICFNIFEARRTLKTVPRVSFNIFQKILMGPLGYRFLEDARAAHRLVFVWTVNDSKLMRWCIRKTVDGVITDDPEMFRRICDRWDEEETPQRRREDQVTWAQQVELLFVAVLVTLLGWTFRYRHLRLQRLIVEDSARHPALKDGGYPKA